MHYLPEIRASRYFRDVKRLIQAEKSSTDLENKSTLSRYWQKVTNHA